MNVLLRAVDRLVTDYSASRWTAALLCPIVYFMPDLEEYAGACLGLYESPSLLTGGLHCRSWSEVLAALRAAAVDPAPYVAAVDSMVDRYWAFLDTGLRPDHRRGRGASSTVMSPTPAAVAILTRCCR